MNLRGICPAGAVRILADDGNVTRFPDRNHFGSWTGTAPLDASSGEQLRRLGQIGIPGEGRTSYYHRKLGEAKTKKPLRCLKRRVSDAVYGHLLADANPRRNHRRVRHRGSVDAGPGGTPGVYNPARPACPPGHRLFRSATTRTRSPSATRPTTPSDTTRRLVSPATTATSAGAHLKAPRPRP
jgi:transposase